MHKVHLDTDLGSDIDDLCALAMLLRWSKDNPFNGCDHRRRGEWP
jgi:hypothetical protein